MKNRIFSLGAYVCCIILITLVFFLVQRYLTKKNSFSMSAPVM